MDDWDEHFKKEGAIWGTGPSEAAVAAVDYFRRKNARKVLDVACGYGRDSVHLAKFFDVTGIDKSQEGLKLAHQNAAEAKVYASFMLGDARWLQFPPDSFDAVLCNNILTLFTQNERDAVAREILRVLAKHGSLIVSELSTSTEPRLPEKEPHTFLEEHGHLHHYFRESELHALFHGVKFEKVEEIEEEVSNEKKKKWLILGEKSV